MISQQLQQYLDECYYRSHIFWMSAVFWKEVYLSVSDLIDENSAVILQLTEDYI